MDKGQKLIDMLYDSISAIRDGVNETFDCEITLGNTFLLIQQLEDYMKEIYDTHEKEIQDSFIEGYEDAKENFVSGYERSWY